MTNKSLLMTGALVLASFTICYAKSYEVVLSTPTKAGNLDLKPGTYTVRLKGNDAVFTDENTAKTYTTPVKVESATTKHDVTEVQTSEKNGATQIQKIELGGSATDLEFGE